MKHPWYQFWHWAEAARIAFYTIAYNLGITGLRDVIKRYKSRPKEIEELKTTRRDIQRKGRHKR